MRRKLAARGASCAILVLALPTAIFSAEQPTKNQTLQVRFAAHLVPASSSWRGERKMLLTAGSELPVMYFLDRPPSDIRTSTLPTTAKEVLLARVRLLGTAAGLGGRIPPGGRGNDSLRERLAVSLRVLEVQSGNASVDSVFDATFGVTDQTHSLIPVPRTKSELERDYFVVVYADDGGHWHLAGFPMSKAEYRS